jgi:DNA-binding LytR/AlgR family response regulator
VEKLFEIKKGNKFFYPKRKTIVRVQAEKETCRIFFDDQTHYSVDQGISKVWARLKSAECFCFVHRSHIVNLNFVKSREDDGTIFIDDAAKTTVPVSETGDALLQNSHHIV